MNSLTHVGLDVHKDSIAVAVLRPGEAISDERIVPNTPEAMRKVFAHFDRAETIACYEAGPTGYETYRLLDSIGFRCEVIAPSLIPRRAGRRVKTDRIDARNLARLHGAGELTVIRVPSPEEEALRDFVRVREDLKADRRRTQQRTRSFLLRAGRRYPARTARWGKAFDAWVRRQSFDEPSAQRTFNHLLAALDARNAHLAQVDREIADAALRPPLDWPVARLRCLRGIDTLSATTLTAEVCDFRRFPAAGAFMGFTGLVPSEHSSGNSSWRGAITKAGNAHIRRVLVEAAWSARHRPAIGPEHRKRLEGQPPEVLAYCWAAQLRLHDKFRKLRATKSHNTAVIAVARELAGFVWGLMNDRIMVN